MNKSGWISVDDRMPEKKLADVLVLIPGKGMFQGCLQFGVTMGRPVWNIKAIKQVNEYETYPLLIFTTEVTHWMELPETKN